MTPTLWIRGARQVVPMDPAFSVVEGGAVICVGDRIAWVGREGDWPEELAPGPGARVVDAGGGVVLPGLIDAHTHAVFAGSRAGEFARRLEGASYEEILTEGGGILGTVRHTRAAGVDELVALARPRLEALHAGGVTTVEIKSGYGLDPDAELDMLRAVRELDRESRWELLPTFLGAHAVPAEYRDDRGAYLEQVVEEMLPAVVDGGLARFCDVFCEPGLAFDVAESRRVLERARALGLGRKIHADQLSCGGGAELAAEVGAVSAEHLEHPSDAGVAAMAASGTVAVLLPGADYFLRSEAHPPIQTFRDHGVPMALSTDMNPGSSPTTSLLLMASLACVRWRMTVPEALAGVTAHAARALGLAEDRGRLEVGLRADVAIFDVPDHRDLAYWFGGQPTRCVIKDGREVWTR